MQAHLEYIKKMDGEHNRFLSLFSWQKSPAESELQAEE